jgi:hypothetical protein
MFPDACPQATVQRRRVRLTSWSIISTGVLDLHSPLAAVDGQGDAG